MPKRIRKPRFRNFNMTFWVEKGFKISMVKEYCDSNNVRYCALSSEEKSKENGNLHHHCYMELNNRCTFTQMLNHFDSQYTHIESARGSAHSNTNYFTKSGTKTGDTKLLYEYGTPKNQGKRNDLIQLRNHYMNKGTHKEAILDNELMPTFARHIKFAEKCKLLLTPQRTETTELYIYWGPTGTGKSHTAYAEGKKNGKVFFKPAGLWWDGYEQQETVILEDFRGEIPLVQMLRLADKYPLKVPIKGGHEIFNSKRIYLTTNIPPDHIWNQEQKGYEVSFCALKRRITKVQHMTERYNKPNIQNN